MARIHTRQKRWISEPKGRKRNPKLKTFKTEEQAKKYAETKGIKDYKLIDLQELNPNKNKIKIIVE